VDCATRPLTLLGSLRPQRCRLQQPARSGPLNSPAKPLSAHQAAVSPAEVAERRAVIDGAAVPSQHPVKAGQVKAGSKAGSTVSIFHTSSSRAPDGGAGKGGAACSASAPSLPASLPGGRAPKDRRLQRRYLGRELKRRSVLHPHWPQIVFAWPAGVNPGRPGEIAVMVKQSADGSAYDHTGTGD
jgi:hypothetical protein